MGDLDIYSTPFGRFLLDPDDGVQGHIAFSGTPWDAWIVPYIEKYARGQLCVDVGAHVGSMAVLMARAGATKVVAYEPQNRLFVQLAANAEMNSPIISARHAACWDKRELVGIATPMMETLCLPGNPKWRTTAPGGVAFEKGSQDNQVRAVVLDEEGWHHPGFIKIDAQGADLLVLRGATQIIQDHRPAIIFEFEEGLAKDLHGHSWQHYLDFFREVGYSLTPCDPSNYLALPKEPRP